MAAGFFASVLLLMNAPARACDPGGPYDPARFTRFYAMDGLVKAALHSGDLDTAARLANEYLDLAGTLRCDWNYGNAIHDANRYLGLISLKKGDGDAATAYLLKAGKSTGSPQLNTFGPDLDLADALLKQGRVDAVKQYLVDIKRFWEMDNGAVAQWLASIERGERPHLDRFSKPPGIVEMSMMGFSLAWPFLLVGGFLYSLRRRISRKWIFAVTSVVSGYIAMFLGGLGASLAMPSIMGGIDPGNATLLITVVALSVSVGFLLSVFVVFGVSRLFIVKAAPG